MMELKRVMFVRDSMPLTQVPVRFLSGTPPTPRAEKTTDGDGQVEIALPLGVNQAEVLLEEAWRACSFQVTEKQSLLVVDVGGAQKGGGLSAITGSFATLTKESLGDRYKFEHVLGRGGMGVVVKARDTLLNRTVAIKMLNDEFLENQDAQQIFLEEARSIATLSHPNLVAIYDVTMLEGRAMIVFEHIEGKDLDTLFSELGRLSEASVLRVGVQLARALKYLHSQGILHRDIKPSNVLLQPDGMVKIIDFGLARPLEQLALKGTRVRGTPAYMAPEQIEGEQLIAATDIYQLGVSLYEMLCGELPFTSGNMAYSHVHLEPPALQERVDLHDSRLAEVIHACLFKAPSDRPTAQELFHTLQAIYAGSAPHYNMDQHGIRSNEQALFSETVELHVPELRAGVMSTFSRSSAPTLDTLPTPPSRPMGASSGGRVAVSSSLEAVGESPPSEWSSNQTLLTVAIGLLLLLFGLGSVIMMLWDKPPEQPAVSSVEASVDPEVIDNKMESVSGERGVTSQKPDATREVVAPVEPALEVPPSTDMDSQIPAVVEDPAEVPPPTEPAPERDPVEVASPTEKRAPVEKKSDEPRPAEQVSAGSKARIDTPPAEKIEAPEVVETPPVEQVQKTPEPAVEEIEEEVVEEPAEEASPGEKRVVRKKIIRKVIRKKSGEQKEDTPVKQAPVSF